MGTRADFYITENGKLTQDCWIGSVAWDGYEWDNKDNPISLAKDKEEFLFHATIMLGKRDDTTFPDQGWPWPWKDSDLTDYAYIFDDIDKKVYVYEKERYKDYKMEENQLPRKSYELPNMESIQKIDYGQRSGVIILGAI
jgi:hypothetical protein